MNDVADSSIAWKFPLIESRTKALKLVAVMILGRALRDIVVPAGHQLARGAYIGGVVAVMLYLMARPGITPSRSLMWAILGGLATTALVAL